MADLFSPRDGVSPPGGSPSRDGFSSDDALSSLDGAEAWVDSWTASMSERATQARALADRVAAITSTARGDQSLVQVTVDGTGAMTELRLDDRVTRWDAAAIATEIMSVMRKAQSGLTNLVIEAADDTVGMDTATGRAVVAGFEQRFRPSAPDSSR